VYHISLKHVKGIELPGRVWKKLVAPDQGGCQKMTFGIVEFPTDARPDAHSHESQEEIIYVISGQGGMEVGKKVFPLESGDAVFIPPRIDHRVTVKGVEPLVLVSVFSPPVLPGSYDPGKP
jgi:quercetin dioxygenase-like cupin family protein